MFGLPAVEQKIWHYVLIVIVVYAIAFLLIRLFSFLITRFFNRASEKLKVDPTNYKFFLNAQQLIVMLVATLTIFLVIPELREIGLTLGAGAGILTIIIGFAAQASFANIIGGIFIVIYKPVRVGDIVQIGTWSGVVEDINLRHTVIRNFENRRIVMPNSVINSETILNSNIIEEEVCIHMELTISFNSDVDKAMEIIQEEALKHPYILDKRTPEDIAEGSPIVVVRLLKFVENGVLLRAYLWAAGPRNAFIMRCDLQKSIKERWDKNQIEIPVPHRSVIIKNTNLADGKEA